MPEALGLVAIFHKVEIAILKYGRHHEFRFGMLDWNFHRILIPEVTPTLQHDHTVNLEGESTNLVIFEKLENYPRNLD